MGPMQGALKPITELAPKYMQATGFDREKANAVLCRYAGVERLADLKPWDVNGVAEYMREVIWEAEHADDERR